MVWRTMDAVSQRKEFIMAWQGGGRTFRGLCEEFGISRPCGYKWVERFKEQGWKGLEEQSRAPHEVPRRTAERTEEELVRVRKEHPTWGPRKLLVVLERDHPDLELPAASTVSAILKRHGLVEAIRRSRTRPTSRPPSLLTTGINDEWAIDYKGQFKMLNGRYCYPLTLADCHSRYLLCCEAFSGISGQDVLETLENVFREYGMPRAIRSDNGAPFCGRGLGAISRFRVWLTKLGIEHIRTRPGHPQDNGKLERLHASLKRETTRPPGRHLKDQQRRFDAWRQEFNNVRPHEALGMRTPERVYSPSRRLFPETLPAIEYPSHYETRQVGEGGCIGWKGNQIWVSEALAGEQLGLLEVDDDIWRIYFGPIELGVLDGRCDWNDPRRKRVLTMCPV